ncbi:hypothetical protein fugu_015543 [Takifugu bimaculatus]|uniref:GP-PDE domain-containing protein n=1 Tax=Takifugu bimaculatus TaxID=433685 RepID=A0A4Z2BZQ9_9TELE|nr:hypothetical protein fugu_015543 [Takifugu bimaculatus]
MLQVGDEAVCFWAVFLLGVLVTRSASAASLLAAFLYVFVAMFRFPPVPPDQAARVLRPRAAAGRVPVLANRGGSHDAPENTLAAIREASRNGATGVELDLSFTADGVPVLMHDETLDRTTNGSGPVNKIAFVQLRRLDAGLRHRLRDKYVGERVPTLQEAVEECLRHQLTIVFDVKGQPDEVAPPAAALRQTYRKFPALYNCSMVASFEPKVVYKMRQTDPGMVTALKHRPWRLSRLSDGAPRTLSAWARMWTAVLDVLLDWAHHHLLWRLCGSVGPVCPEGLRLTVGGLTSV